MGRAVEFDNQLVLKTNEIDDIGTDRSLSTEFETADPTIFELSPQEALSRC